MSISKKYNVFALKQFLFLMLFAFPVLPLKFSNSILIAFCVLVLFLILNEKPKLVFSDYKFYLLFVALFMPYLIEYLMHHNDKGMQLEIEKKLLFCVAPVFFYLNSLLSKKPEIKTVIWIYILSISILSVISVFYLLANTLLFSEVGYQNGAFELRTVFENFSGLHPTYYGLFSITASLWIIYYFQYYSKKYKILLVIALFFMLLLNVFIAAKMPLIILTTGLFWIAYKKIPNKLKFFLFTASILCLLILVCLITPSLRSRISEVFNFFLSPSVNNTILERYVVFTCGKMVFVQDLYTGIGVRNTQNLLDFCYMYFKFYKGYTIHLNSHNQYLTFGISYGIGYLVFFIGFLVSLFKKIKTNPLGFIFWCCSVLIMFTESILERQMGVYFFLLFSLLFLYDSQNNSTTRKMDGF